MSKEITIENLRALVFGKKLNTYQRSLALQEFTKLESKLKEAEEEVECCNCGNEIVEYKHLAFGLCEECRKRTI